MRLMAMSVPDRALYDNPVQSGAMCGVIAISWVTVPVRALCQTIAVFVTSVSTKCLSGTPSISLLSPHIASLCTGLP